MNKYFWMTLVVVALFSCKNPKAGEKANSWESGQVNIKADANLEDILGEFSEAYEHDFTEADINYTFGFNDSLIRQFVAGEINCMIVTRELTANEAQFASLAQDIKIKQNVFAFSGIALIANNDFADTVVDLGLIKKYLSEKNTEVVFDHAQSGIAKFMMQKLSLEPALIKNAKSAGSVEAVIQYVQQKNGAIGFIPFSYISDPDKKSARDILDAVRVLDVKWQGKQYAISQQSIAYENYPLRIPMNFVRGVNYEPLADGFISYLLKERAARILLRAGLVPVNMPVRNYNIQNEIPVGDDEK